MTSAGPAGDAEQPSLASPPTARTVAILELLVGTEEPLRITEIAQRLGLNRSTCSAILDTLEQLQWVERTDVRTYRSGAGLIPFANAVRGRLPILPDAERVMGELVHRLGLDAVTLSRVDGGYMTFVETVHRIPNLRARPSFRLPIFPPFGAAVAAFRPDAEREHWIALATDPVVREHIAGTIESVRRHGVAVWHYDSAGHALQRAVAVSEAFSRRHAAQRSDEFAEPQLASLALAIGRSGYSAEQLQPAEAPFAVSYLAAPVFDAHDQPCFSLEPHVLRTDVSVNRLSELVAGARDGADELTSACGGDPSHFAWEPLDSSL